MTGPKAASRLDKALRFALSVLVLLPAAFSAGASAQEIRIERVGLSAPVDGAGAAAALPAGGALIGAGVVSAAPSVLSPSIEPGAVPVAAAAAGAVPALPASALRAAPAAAAEGLQRPAAAAAPARLEAPAALPGDSAAAPGSRVRPALRGAICASVPALQADALAADGPASAESDRDAAQRGFSALLGERLAETRYEAPAPVASPAASSGSPRLRAAARAGAGVITAAVPGILALGGHPSLPAWHSLSVAGYVVGNFGAAIFPLVQIYETFHGKTTPKSRAIVGAAASLALGLICAPILHKTLWGLQNLFGGLTLLVPLFLGAIKGRARGNGLKETALISAGALAVAGAAYFAAAAALPPLLAAVLSASAIAKLAMVVQFATSAMFLWMFLPDAVKALRGKAAGGFSPGFNMMFFLSAVGSMIWAVPSAWIFDDAHQGTYRMIFIVNAIYALVSFLSFWLARREGKPGKAA